MDSDPRNIAARFVRGTMIGLSVVMVFVTALKLIAIGSSLWVIVLFVVLPAGVWVFAVRSSPLP